MLLQPVHGAHTAREFARMTRHSRSCETAPHSLPVADGRIDGTQGCGGSGTEFAVNPNLQSV